jgi:hypothetical protein
MEEGRTWRFGIHDIDSDTGKALVVENFLRFGPKGPSEIE